MPGSAPAFIIRPSVRVSVCLCTVLCICRQTARQTFLNFVQHLRNVVHRAACPFPGIHSIQYV